MNIIFFVKTDLKAAKRKRALAWVVQLLRHWGSDEMELRQDLTSRVLSILKQQYCWDPFLSIQSPFSLVLFCPCFGCQALWKVESIHLSTFLFIWSAVWKKRPLTNEASELEISCKFHRFCRSQANEGYHWVITRDIFVWVLQKPGQISEQYFWGVFFSPELWLF